MTDNIPTCPAILRGEAKKEWTRITKELDAKGLLTQLDRGVLTAYCQCWARWVDLEKKLSELNDLWVLVGVGAAAQLHPRQEYKIAMDQIKALKELSVVLGLCPTSRAKLKGKEQMLQQQKKSTKPVPSVPKHIKLHG